jgi:methionyl-tRNA formyltransferase
MDLHKPAERLEREVRAYAVWPKSRLSLGEHQVTVTKARVAQAETDGTLVIACNPGWLEILELTAPSGKTMSGADFKRGYLRD